MEQGKIGLVVEGGGMKCAYNAGILDAFLDAGISFDYCIGVSAGSGNLASYLAGQRGRNLRFFTEHIHSPRYFGLKSLMKTGDLFGLQYIYGELTCAEGQDPLDFNAFMKNPAEYEAVVTNALTGKPEYFGREMMKQDEYRLIMASSASRMPSLNPRVKDVTSLASLSSDAQSLNFSKVSCCACVSVPMLIVCLLGGMGFGDVKLYFVLGLLLGWQKTLVLFLFSAVLGAAGSLIVMAVRKRKARGEGEDAADNIPENSTDPDMVTDESTDPDRVTDGSTDPDAISEDMTNSDIVRGETTDIDASARNAAKIEQTPEEDTPSDKNRGKARKFFKKRGEEGEEREDAFTRAAKRGSAVPFGPFIALATVVALYGGDAIISFYARILRL